MTETTYRDQYGQPIDGDLRLYQQSDAWGEPVTEEEHRAACERMEMYLTEHEPDDLSITVRPCPRGQVGGLYAWPSGTTARPVECAPLRELLERAWEHACRTWPR